MKKIVIFGTTEYAAMMKDYLEDDGHSVVAFCVDKKYMVPGSFNGLPVVAWEKLSAVYQSRDHALLIALGYTQMNRLRAERMKQAEAMGYELQSYIHKSAVITRSEMGQGNVVLENVTIGNHSRIGIGNVFQVGVTIAHNAQIGDFSFFGPACALAGDVTVGRRCFLGTNCTVRDGVSIADETLVGAGAYIGTDTKSKSVYVPERTVVLKKTSIEMKI